jgi:deoxyribodipyrimidine photo-lyase
MPDRISIFWFRRDLRLDDNAGLYNALRSGFRILPVFIFDTNILDELEEKADRRISFIHHYLQQIQTQLLTLGSTFHVLHSSPMQAFEQLTATYDIAAVYTNHDYEPYARQRDKEVSEYLLQKNIPLYTYKDQVVFEKNEIVKDNNEPYTVFTPYSRKWKSKLNNFYLKSYQTEKYFGNFITASPLYIPSVEELGFKKTGSDITDAILNKTIAVNYDKTRDYPGIDGTTRLSVHLRFGTISIRKLASNVKVLNETLLNELIWREFYQMILWHYPHVVNTAFKKEYDKIQWRNNEEEFKQWCDGNTGYPIVDAGMRELNETGYMHNRVRMVVASFLAKHLLIDWRWGEAYFAAKLMDYDLAANNGGWQWAAGSGCDAAPYFRVFNPYLQTEKFDPELKYIKKWIPEFGAPSYPKPIAEHSYARNRCLAVYKDALSKTK